MKGERRFALTAQQYRAIAVALAPIRPTGQRALYPDQPGCERAATDMRTIQVQWGDRDELIFYTGCEGRENGRILDALSKAEQLMPASQLAADGRRDR